MTHETREILGLLERTQPFLGASAAERETLAAAARLVRGCDGSPFFLEGERPAAAWIVLSGRVRILSFVNASRTFQIERFGPRQLFGICCRLGGGGDRYACTAIAEGETLAVRLPDAAFYPLYRRSEAVARATCELCARRLRGMRRLVSARRSVRQRLAQVLLGLREGGGDEVRATRHALSTWVGAAPETVFRALAHLRRRGIVSTGRGIVRVLDVAALEAEGRAADGGAAA
ncbi:MAG: Crp/Fnr family transcriptional regulator [Elusimicrobia bacterium]|nr:Crp/Fnr family transcriptional regulator [Elusimicrobiota bacterium]